jgi:hypothetical protein
MKSISVLRCSFPASYRGIQLWESDSSRSKKVVTSPETGTRKLMAHPTKVKPICGDNRHPLARLSFQAALPDVVLLKEDSAAGTDEPSHDQVLMCHRIRTFS